MPAPTIQGQPHDDVSEAPAELADIFDLDAVHQDIGELGVWAGGDDDEHEDDADGDTTGDGCGESPPQGPTSGC
ncbi:hypothetical protein [Streptomyces sp. NPDC058653]|uniref:hypothetical protein n=1 Tax=Streptomyces sp. NPDC058653 TaxID=3346576 RepID=UPI003650AABE